MEKEAAIKGFLAMFGSTMIVGIIYSLVYNGHGQEHSESSGLAKVIGDTARDTMIPSDSSVDQIEIPVQPANVIGNTVIDNGKLLDPNVSQPDISMKTTIWQTLIDNLKTSFSMKTIFAVTTIVILCAAVAVYWMTLQEEPFEDPEADLDKESKERCRRIRYALIFDVLLLVAFLTSWYGLPALHRYREKRRIENERLQVINTMDAFFAQCQSDNTVITASGFQPKHYSLTGKPVDPSLIPDVPTKSGSPFATDYTKGAMIGEGGQGTVYEATKNDGTAQKVAIKEIESDVMRVIEAKLLKYFGDLDPQRFVKQHDYYVQTEDGKVRFLYIVMDLLDGITLRGTKPVDKESVAIIARETLEAIKRIHSVGWRHRDIKPENMFVTRDGQVKLLDLGLASPIGVSTRSGTKFFFAPELNKDIDICVPAATVTIKKNGTNKQLPLTKKVKMKILFKCRMYEPIDIFSLGKTLYLLYPLDDDADFNEMIGLMMHAEPWKRPTAASLLTHPFIIKNAPPGKNIDFNAVKTAMGV